MVFSYTYEDPANHVFCLPWVLEQVCRIVTFMWTSGPLATVNIKDSRAVFRMDLWFHMGIVCSGPTAVLM